MANDEIVVGDIVEMIENALNCWDDIAGTDVVNILSYSDAEVLTYDQGIVIKMSNGSEFQVTVKQSK
jgi:hypothetical protein